MMTETASSFKRRRWKIGIWRYSSFLVTPLFALEVGTPAYDVQDDKFWYGIKLWYSANWNAGPAYRVWNKVDESLVINV